MITPAYDEGYLDDMMQKTEYLFQLIARSGMDAFQVIKDYMSGEYRKYMDMGNPLYLNKTPKQILGSLGVRADLNAEISEQYDEFILEWVADVYTYMQWKYALSSKTLVERIKPEVLYQKFNPLHEASVERGAGKLMELYFGDN